MKRWIAVALCSLLWGTSAFAVQTCNTTSITASTPTADFIDNGNGTVTHSKTGLMWKRCSEGLSGAGCATGTAIKYTWQGALQAAQTLNAAGGFAGFTDWRVPNQKELNSIIERRCYTPAINATVFPIFSNGAYWSASPLITNVFIGAHAVDFMDGRAFSDLKTISYYVLLVRGGH